MRGKRGDTFCSWNMMSFTDCKHLHEFIDFLGTFAWLLLILCITGKRLEVHLSFKFPQQKGPKSWKLEGEKGESRFLVSRLGRRGREETTQLSKQTNFLSLHFM